MFTIAEKTDHSLIHSTLTTHSKILSDFTKKIFFHHRKTNFKITSLQDKLSFFINALTRIRICDDNGKILFSFKKGIIFEAIFLSKSVISSTFDEPAQRHVAVAEMVPPRAPGLLKGRT